MGALRSYHFTERLSSGQRLDPHRARRPGAEPTAASNEHGFRSVIIGGTRWDFLDGRWERQRFPGLDVRDVLMWYDARTPRVVGRKANGDTDLAAFSLKPVPSWFRLTVEPLRPRLARGDDRAEPLHAPSLQRVRPRAAGHTSALTHR